MNTEEIEAMTVPEWIDRYYKRDRLTRDPGTRERIIADRENDLRELGCAAISRHDSNTGESVVLYNPRWRPEGYIRWLVSDMPETSGRSGNG